MSDRRELEERASEAIARATEALRDELPPVTTMYGVPVIVDELMPADAVVLAQGYCITHVFLVDRAR